MSEKIGQLKLRAPDGKLRETDCANTETMFRIIQSIPSPKAELFAENARRELEQKSGKKTITKENYLPHRQAGFSLKDQQRLKDK